MASTRDLQYCKTDLIASKGIVFCKYSKASSALIALEEITETGMVRALLRRQLMWKGSASHVMTGCCWQTVMICVDACSWQGTRSSACWQSPKAKATVRCNRPQSSAQPISIRYEPAPCMSRIQIQTGSGCHTTCPASMCLPGLELLCVLQLQTPRSGWATSCLSEAHIGMQGMEALAPSSPLSAPYPIVVCMPRILSVCLASCTAC